MELQNEKFEGFIREEPIFQNYFSNELINKISQYMVEVSASPDEIIFDVIITINGRKTIRTTICIS